MEVQLVSKKLCTGCAICHDTCSKKCIKMQPYNGFLFPEIDQIKCTRCGVCQDNCPALNENAQEKNEPRQIYLAFAIDDEIKKRASSGGIASVLMKDALLNNYYVVGAAFDNMFTLKHVVTNELAKLQSLIGSKYLQSDTRNIYYKVKELLKRSENVLFCGTPCQIAALSFLKEEERAKLITVEFLCHGVPSPLLWEQYKSFLQKKHNGFLVDYNFRSKVKGWGAIYISIYIDRNRKKYKKFYPGYSCIWHLWLGKHFSIRESCFNCKYRSKQRLSDITVGDFWQYKSLGYSCSDEQRKKGFSTLFVNTFKGEHLIETIHEKIYKEHINKETYWETVKNLTILNQHNIPVNYDIFWQDYNQMSFDRLLRKYNFAVSPLQHYIQAIKYRIGLR